MGPASGRYGHEDRYWFGMRTCFLTSLIEKKHVANSLWFWHGVGNGLTPTVSMTSRFPVFYMESLSKSRSGDLTPEKIPVGGKEKSHLFLRNTEVPRSKPLFFCNTLISNAFKNSSMLFTYLKGSLLLVLYFFPGKCKEVVLKEMY